MAIVYPPNPNFQTQGEKLFFEKLLMPLTDEWYIFYEPIISGNKPDFIVFHPVIGISIIEVKDYNINTIKYLNPKTWEIQVDDQIKIVKSPLEQAITYRNTLINLLSNNKILISNTTKYQGRLKIPISILCCFPFISKNEGIYNIITKFISTEMLLVKEEMDHSDTFINKFTNSFNKLFIPEELTITEVKALIKEIYPDITLEKKKEDINKIEINQFLKSATFRKFDNYLDELIFIADTVTDWFNTEKIELEKIIIVFNKTRSILPNSKEYLTTLLDLFKQRNLEFTLDLGSKNSIFLCSYENFSKINTSFYKKIIFIDFNIHSYNHIKNLYIPKRFDHKSFYITSCYPMIM